MNAALDALVRLLGPGAVFRGSQGTARCPCHDDRKPSLSFRVGTKRPVVAKCHGCQATLPEILEKLGASEEDRRLILGTVGLTPLPEPERTYIYRDENRVPLSRTVRRSGKKFHQERYEGGRWIPGLDGVRPVPYRLPEVLESIQRNETLYVAEGEKDVENLVSLGLSATCNSGGAKNWRPEFTELLRGARQVVVLEDNDKTGQVRALQVAESFRSKGVLDVRVVRFAELPVHGDVSDWLSARGGSNDEKRSALLARVEGAPKLAAPTALDPTRQGQDLAFEVLVPWPDPVDGAVLLSEIAGFLDRFMKLPPHAATTIALWIVFTYALDAAQCSPRLFLTSPQRACGKSRLLGLIGMLVWRPLASASVTQAALFRVLQAYAPTLLLDEIDNARLKENPDLRSVLNSGHTRLAPVLRVEGDEHCVRSFSAWGGVALAGIGGLPDTTMSRSIVIEMQRRKRHEKVERVREARLLREMAPLRQRIFRWATDKREALRDADPNCPELPSDRDADNWEPLLAIADLAAGPWPKRARDAALAISGIAVGDDTEAVRLLDGVRAAPFTEDGKLPSAALVRYLVEMEDQPWSEWRHGKAITAPQVATLLRPFGIAPDSIRIGHGTVKGYTRDQFTDAWERYGAPEGGTPEQYASGAPATGLSGSEQSSACSGPQSGVAANNDAGCSVVPAQGDNCPSTVDSGLPEPAEDLGYCPSCGDRLLIRGGEQECIECHRRVSEAPNV